MLIPGGPVHVLSKLSATDLAHLKRTSVRGGALTIAAQAIVVSLQLISTMVLARLLSPADFGSIAMVVSVTAFAGLFRDLGLSTASVQKQELTEGQSNSLFWINVSLGTAMTVIVAAAAPLIAWFYQQPHLVWLTVLLSTIFLMSSLGAQHGAVLQRKLNFSGKAIADISGAVVALLVSASLAWSGFRYWALAFGLVAGTATSTIVIWIASPFRPGTPAWSEGILPLLKFGGRVTLFEVLNYFHRNLDSVLIGRVWGAVSLGLYSRAYQLIMFPIINLRAPINRVAFPAMSRLKNDPAAFRTYYRRVSCVLAYVTMPLMAFVFVAAEPLIVLALGRRWIDAVPVLRYLSAAAFIMPVASLRGLVILSMGRTGDYLKLGGIYAVGTALGFIAGLPWGPQGVALGYSVVTYLLLYPTLLLGFNKTDIRVGDFFSAIRFPASASLIAVVVVTVIAQQIPPPTLEVVQLIEYVGAFVLVWLVSMLCFPGGWREMKNMARLTQYIRSP